MNLDPLKSAQSCGCDEGAGWVCEQHRGPRRIVSHETMGEIFVVTPQEGLQVGHPTIEAVTVRKDEATAFAFAAPVGSRLFGNDAKGRKGFPVFTGALMYFPDAFAAMADVSKAGNDQHNPGEPLHWARGKSTDQMDTAVRHMMDHGTGYTKDADGKYHLAKALWRIAAELQLTIEKERGSR